MAENDPETTQATTEKEIIINLDDQTDSKNSPKSGDIEVNEEPKPKLASKFVDRKQIVDLTDDERALIVQNAKNGLDQPHFNVKFFKNGKYRILKKKEQAPTVSQKAINSNIESTKPTEKKVFYSDNQLLFEHIMELNSKVDRLMQKHKKLKRKYQTLQNDIYVDDEEDAVHEQNNEEQLSDSKLTKTIEEETKPSVEVEPPQPNVFVRQGRASWRNNIKYL